MVTYLSEPEPKIKNADATKMVLFANTMIFAYSGLAELDGKTTDNWLAQTLHESPSANPSNVLEHLARKATEVFAIINYAAEWKRHVFAAVGWMRQGEDESYKQHFWYVSNYHDCNGQMSPVASNRFNVNKYAMADVGYAWQSFGANMNDRQRQWLERRLRNRFDRSDYSPQQIISVMVESTRQVAKENGRVGRGVLAGFIPRTAAGASELRLEGPLKKMPFRSPIWGDELMKDFVGVGKSTKIEPGRSIYFADFPVGRHEADQRSPHFVFPGELRGIAEFYARP